MAVLRYFHQPPKATTSTVVVNNTAILTVSAALNNKVDKSAGRGLSQNNYSTPEKNKLEGVEEGAEVNVLADWNEQDTESDAYILNKPSVPILDPSGQIPASYLPSYVDDVLEYSTYSLLPLPGETGKIYVTTDTDLAYRWSGSTYVEISKSIITGVKGDAESNYRIGNVNLTAANIGLGNVVNLDLSKAIKSITRSGTTFTYTCLDGTTGTFTLLDNNTTYSAGSGLSLSGTTFSLALTKAMVTTALGYTPPTSDTNTWRGIQDNLTSSTNTTESLSAKLGYLLANGSARDNTKLPLAGGTMTGSITMRQEASARNVGIVGTYDYTKSAAIWAMGASYQIPAAGNSLGSLYGAAYVYQGLAGQGTMAGGHQFVWAQNGNANVALGTNIWTSGKFIKNGGTSSLFLKADGSVDSNAYITGITKAMVTTALGYTPPTTDHTYNFAGVSFTSGQSNTGEHNANNITSNGVWYYTSNGPATSLGASSTDGALYSQAYSTSWVGQIAQDYRNGRLFVRGKNNNTWQPWLRVALTGESLPASDVYAWAKASTKPSYAWSEITSKPSTFTPSSHTHDYLPLSGGTCTGEVAIKSNADAKYVKFYNTNYTDFAGYVGAGSGSNDYIFLEAYGNNSIIFRTDNTLRCLIDGDGKWWFPNHTSLYGGGELNIRGSESGGTIFLSYCCSMSGNNYWYIPVDGKAKFVSVSLGSDIRKKDIVSDTDISITTIAQAPLFKFLWKDKNIDDSVHIGTSAQYWKENTPELVTEEDNEDKTLSIEYSTLGVAASISIAKEVVKMQNKIDTLEQRILQLEEQLSKLIK